MSWENINPREELEHMVRERGGWVNSHAHIDRSYIINRDNWSKTGDNLQVKWSHTDQFKASASVETILGHMSRVVENQLAQDTQALGSFIDCDSVVRNKNILAAEKLKERYGKEIQLVFMNQPIKGLVDPIERRWFEEAAEFVDIIGGLPERDSSDDPALDNFDYHLETIFELAIAQNKPLHIHADQKNSPSQQDTEKILKKVEAGAMLGRVTLVHCISLAAQQEIYRKRMYKKMKDLGVSVISCPTAWIDSRRNEVLAPTHNSSTPVDEMIEAGVNVAIGTDNIADIYKPFSDGDMWTELRFLLEANHYYNLQSLANIATINGLHSLSIDVIINSTKELSI